MGRKKQSKVDKSPFKLRRRKLTDGRESLFIDRTVDGKHEYEFLKLYLVPENSVKAKRENAKTLRQAEELIIAKTEKGKGVSYMENQVGWHGTAPNKEQYETAMQELTAALHELEGC